MALYSTRQRDPLLDSTMQAAIEKRGKELLGLGLIVLGIMAAMMLWSYSPEDPNWMLATDAPVQNWMGRIGASIAAPLMMVVGKASWWVPVLLVVWGLRLTAHMGAERAIGRLIYFPIPVVIATVYAATIPPGAEWTHSFGLGGMFGYTALGAILTLIPVGEIIAVKLVTFGAGVMMALVGLFVMGFTRPELRTGWRFFLYGLIVVYSLILRLLGRGAEASVRVAQSGYANVQARRETSRAERDIMRQEADAELWIPDPDPAAMPSRTASIVRTAVARKTPTVAEPAQHHLRAEPRVQAAPPEAMRSEPFMPRVTQRPMAAAPLVAQSPAHPVAPAAPQRITAASPAPSQGGLFSGLMPRMLRKSPDLEPELVDQEPPMSADAGAPDEDRIRARISDVIRSRNAPPPPPPVSPITKTADGLRIEPSFVAARRPRPLMVEPPVMRSDMARHDHVELSDAPEATDFYAPVEEYEDRVFERPVQNSRYLANDSDDEPIVEMGIEAAPMGGLPELESWNAADMALDDEDNIFVEKVPPVRLPSVAPQAQRRVVQPTVKRPVQPSKKAQTDAQPSLRFEEPAPDYDLPPLNLLRDPADVERHHMSNEALEENARMLESVLDDYGIKGEIVSVRPGPVVTMYELEPAPGLKASRVIGLADDIARSMSALSARVSTVPGRSVIGIELPNDKRETVVLREILSCRDFGDSNMRLPLALGKDIGGEPIVANLAKMPHLLIAGTTGSGKSVAINTMILSLLYRLRPDECRLIMIDPKMLELSVYDGIPHLLSPVVTDPKKAVVALKWVVGEMEERYRKMSKMGVRNIEGYNGRVRDALSRGEMFERTVQTGFDEETGDPIFETEELTPVTMPYIVVIVDEMADLMMVAGKEIEACIQRLAQMARASGIHLIMATQRPSVDVITGTIKANFPTRISFQVTSKIDSRTILGEQGAEQLLGMGDMLYMAGGGRITRVHGPFVSDEEVEEIVSYLKAYGPPEYMSGVVDGPDDEAGADIDAKLGLGGNSDGEDALYDQAVAIVIKDRKCSTSYIQRKLAIGYNKAARLVEQMEDEGVVSAANHVGKRDILVPEQH